MKLNVNYLNNYDKHENGHIWFCWDDNRVEIEHVSSTNQMIHCKVMETNGKFMYWMTARYWHTTFSIIGAMDVDL